MKVLVIDDDPKVAWSVQRMLREHDVTIEQCPAHAVQALALYASLGEPFDIIVCDHQMPGMSGLDVLAAARTIDEVPMFILMSGDDESLETADCDGVVSKPFRRPDIVAVIERAARARSVAITRPLRLDARA